MLSFLSQSTSGLPMFDDEFLGQRQRSFPSLGHAGGMMGNSGSQPFPFAGFHMHHDTMPFPGQLISIT